MSREIPADAADHDDGKSFEIAVTGLSLAAATEFTDEVERLLSSLDEGERTLADLETRDCTNEEAAVKMRASERTERRIPRRIRQIKRLTDKRPPQSYFDRQPQSLEKCLKGNSLSGGTVVDTDLRKSKSLMVAGAGL